VPLRLRRNVNYTAPVITCIIKQTGKPYGRAYSQLDDEPCERRGRDVVFARERDHVGEHALVYLHLKGDTAWTLRPSLAATSDA
jgi:hypothetical protein